MLSFFAEVLFRGVFFFYSGGLSNFYNNMEENSDCLSTLDFLKKMCKGITKDKQMLTAEH